MTNGVPDEDMDAGTREQRMRQLDSLSRNLGDTVVSALADPKVVEVMLNSDGRLWIEAFGQGMYDSGQKLRPQDAEKVIITTASMLGFSPSRENPIVEGELPLDGSRFEGILSPIVKAPIFAIRKPASRVFTLKEYLAQGVLTNREDPLNSKSNLEAENFARECEGLMHIEILTKAILAHKNIFVFGGTGTGKTTFINALIDCIAEVTRDRVVLIEDTNEIKCRAPNSVLLRTSETVNISRLLRATLRLRPDRILVGEVRGPECAGLLKAWNTGHPGGLATAHANSAAEGMMRIEQMVEEAGIKANPKVIASIVHIVVFIDREGELAAGRKVREVALVTGYDVQKQEYLFRYL